ncbi:MAG TPA: PHP domain-containing protein [Longimicrobiales bacterium]|nr:PHP domain-containing protein [Longimicrobiales bacterium]
MEGGHDPAGGPFAQRDATPAWAPLHLRSDLSIGVGTASVSELVRRLSADGVRAAALTDVEGVHAQPRFQALCELADIHPVVGVELRDRPEAASRTPSSAVPARRALLLARDPAGWERICRVVTRRREARAAGRTRARGAGGTDLVGELADVGAEGIFVLTDDPDVATSLASRAAVPAEALRLLLVRPRPRWPEPRVRSAARELGAALVADPDPVFLEPGDHALHRLLRALADGRVLGDRRLERTVAAPERWLPAPREVLARYADVPEALAESVRVAEACRVRLAGMGPAPPRPPDTSPQQAERELERRAWARLAAARAGGRCVDGAYDARLARELDVLRARGLSGLLLLVEVTRRERVPAAARGSAVGSLVGHLLGLSDVDPLEAGLHFERFVHPRRSSMPDVDLDVSSLGRERLIVRMPGRFGAGHVALACAVHTFRRRSAWREGLGAVGLPPDVVERVMRAMPTEAEALELEERAASERASEPLASVLRELPAWAPPLVRRLLGRPRGIARHPGGLVVSPEPLVQSAPMEPTEPTVPTGEGVRMLQLDADGLEAVGLVKVDLLGSRGLAEMEVAIAQLPRTGELAELAGALARAGPGAVPPDDGPTLELLDRGDTVGIGQVETPAIRGVLEQVPVRRLADLTAVLALVRPGIGASRAKERFVRLARGEAVAGRATPLLERALAGTRGVLLYEEDAMRVLAEAAGIGLEEADELRRALVAAGHDARTVAGLGRRFLRRARARGAGEADAEAVWEEVARLVAYSFNKAHASSYALLAYRLGFLRRHAPVAFACGVLDHYGGAYPMRTVAAAVARWGVKVRAPHVACSLQESAPERGGVRLGLARLKTLRARTARRILEARAQRPFADLRDFRARARPSAAEARALVLAGACDGVEPLAPERYPFAHLEALGAPARTAASPRGGGDAARYAALFRVREELRFLEMHPSAHPLAILREDARALGCLTLEEARAEARGRAGSGAGPSAGEALLVAAVLAAARRVPTSAGTLRFLTLEDETGLLEAVLLPSVHARLGHVVTTPGPYVVEGYVRDDLGHRYLEIREIAPFHLRLGRRVR